MAKKLTASEATWSRAVTFEILNAGGLIKTPAKSIRTENIGYSNVDSSAAAAVCNEIKFRAFDFHKLNSAFTALASNSFYDLHTRWSRKLLTPNQIANILAAFCAQCEIYWDDVNTHKTTIEMDVYRKTIFGKACWDFGCFLSQHAGGKKTTRATAGRTPGATPKSGYKSSGPKSGLVKCLVGEPGEKIYIKDRYYLYAILCRSSKSKKQYVYINPLSSGGGKVGKVRLGDPSGYSACKLLFDDRAKAETAVDMLRKGDTVVVPDFVEGFELVKVAVDSNGYFMICTDLGNVYISASKLNEALEEACKDAVEECATSKSRYPDIDDVDTYHEAMMCFE